MRYSEALIAKIRRLTQALLVSGSLNILLAAAFIYWTTCERPPTPYCTPKTAIESPLPAIAVEKSCGQAIASLRLLPFDKLCDKLASRRPIESGYLEGHLAAGVLLTYHEFDLKRALAGMSLPRAKRSLLYLNGYGVKEQLQLYADLSDKQLEAMARFAATESYPFTSCGLFRRLRSSSHDSALAEAFTHTEEFHSAERLLGSSCSRSDLLDMLLEGSWEALERLASDQEPTVDSRRLTLLAYLEQGSAAAAQLLLKEDEAFAIKKVDDKQAVALLRLCSKKTAAAARYALAMLISPRSDAVWHAAADRLYAFVGEEKPPGCDRRTALARFLPVAAQESPPQAPAKAAEKQSPPRPKKSGKRAYMVQEGDSLWKIAQRYNADIKALKKINKLEGEALKPGTLLLIP